MKFCKSLPVILVVVAATFASCGKMDMATPDTTPVNPGTPPPSGGNSSDIQGVWNFVSIHMVATSTAITDNSKAIIYNNYYSKNNIGTLAIDANTIKTEGFGYSIDTTLRTVAYQDGILLADIEMPFKMTQPPSSSSTPYKKIGDDSLYFEQGFIESPIDGAVISTDPSGCRISWLGDTLLMTAIVSSNKVISQNGSTSTVSANGFTEIKLVRKK